MNENTRLPAIPDSELLDLVVDSIVVTDDTDRIVLWNTGSETIYGWKRDEVLGRSARELFQTPEPTPDIEVASDEWHGELWRATAKDEKRLIETRRKPMSISDGRNGTVETGRDITATRQAEDELRKSEHRYRNLFQAMAASFWELDFFPVGNILYQLRKAGKIEDYASYFAEHPEFVREMMRQTRVVDVNDQTVRVFGRGNKDELLTSVEPFWPEESSHVYAASVVASVTGKLNFSAETRLRRIDGSEFDALFTACFPPDTMNKGTLLVGVIDITERKRAFAELKESEARFHRIQAEFAHASRVSMLGEIAASIAHEVNQPLAAISASSAAGLLWLGRNDPDIGEVQTLMHRIAADTRRAADIIGRVRAMALPAAPQHTQVAVNEVIQDIALFLQHELRKNGVHLAVSTVPDLPAVIADRIQLQQVFVNLAMNAIQAMTVAGTEQPCLNISSRLDEDAVVVGVGDNGPGIDDDHLPKLFDSFFSTKQGGMGMGLAIVRNIVEAFGGSIAAENQAQNGALFTLRLPVQSSD